MAKSSFLPRYQKVVNIVRKRILHGDYALKPIPSERRLAQELGVNAMTARHGLQILEKEGLLVRQSNGRMAIRKAEDGVKSHLNFAFLTPTLASHWIESWRLVLEKVTGHLQSNIRTVVYMHWDDPLLLDALNGFDGIFLVPSPEPMPTKIKEQFLGKKHPVVAADQDLTDLGIPSIQLFPPVFNHKLLDHLDELGHKKIGCLNTQPENPVIEARINAWLVWLEAHGYSGRLVNEPVAPYGNAMYAAHTAMSRQLASSKRDETAWYCTTIDCAIGAMKAALDRGIKPGRDLALCAANGEGIASHCYPPITALEAADPTPFLSRCVRWMMNGGKEWTGPLLMQPTEIPLCIRESTDPDLAARLPIL
ncbi:MAG: substrate-binding domain-containing protein [Chthoniobacterales bacterium]